MTLFYAFEWLSQTHFSVALRDSTWGFAAIETVHLLALGCLGGTILVVDLRLLGIGLRKQPTAQLARDLSPVLLSSLIAMIVSGVLLMAAETMKCYYNPVFRVKMYLLLFTLAFYFVLHRHLLRSGSSTVWSKAAAVVSLSLWFSIAFAGRLIGFI